MHSAGLEAPERTRAGPEGVHPLNRFPEASVAARQTFRFPPRAWGPGLVAFGFLADLAGVVAGAAPLYFAGYWLAPIGLLLVLVGLGLSVVPGWPQFRLRGPSALTGAGIGILVNWVRGHPGVPPDAPILAANLIAAALLLWSVRPVARPAPPG